MFPQPTWFPPTAGICHLALCKMHLGSKEPSKFVQPRNPSGSTPCMIHHVAQLASPHLCLLCLNMVLNNSSKAFKKRYGKSKGLRHGLLAQARSRNPLSCKMSFKQLMSQISIVQCHEESVAAYRDITTKGLRGCEQSSHGCMRN